MFRNKLNLFFIILFSVLLLRCGGASPEGPTTSIKTTPALVSEASGVVVVVSGKIDLSPEVLSVPQKIILIGADERVLAETVANTDGSFELSASLSVNPELYRLVVGASETEIGREGVVELRSNQTIASVQIDAMSTLASFIGGAITSNKDEGLKKSAEFLSFFRSSSLSLDIFEEAVKELQQVVLGTVDYFSFVEKSPHVEMIFEALRKEGKL